jgi:hypothetical protein
VRSLIWGELWINLTYLQGFNQKTIVFGKQPNFDKRDSLRREKAYKREIPVRSDSCHRQVVTTFSVIILSAGAYVCFSSRLSKFGCTGNGRPSWEAIF